MTLTAVRQAHPRPFSTSGERSVREDYVKNCEEDFFEPGY
jgi:hypothetical protein